MTWIRTFSLAVSCTLALLAAAPAVRAAEPCKADDEGMYRPAHLQDLARGLAKIQAAALKRIIRKLDDPNPITDAQKFTSSSGLLVIYTVHAVSEPGKPLRYLHMMSFSNGGCYLATPYSKTFLAFFHDLLGLEADASMARRTPKGVTELFAVLSEAEHQALVKRGVRLPGTGALDSMLVECMVGGGKLPLGPAPIDLPRKKLCSMH